MKKIAFVLFTHCFVFGLCAQPSHGISLGLSINHPSLSFSSTSVPVSMLTGYGLIIGGFTSIALNKQLLFRPALEISFRTVKEKQPYGTFSHPEQDFDLSLPLVYAAAKDGTGWLLGGGPTFNYWLDKYWHFYETKRADVGLCGFIGYEVPIGFSFSFRYTLGLLNESNNTTAVQSYKNRHAAVVLGYLF